MPKGRVTFSRLKDIIWEHLEDNVGKLEDFEITFAKLEEDTWRANVEFVVEGDREDTPQAALFGVNAASGEVTEFQKGYTWRD